MNALRLGRYIGAWISLTLVPLGPLVGQSVDVNPDLSLPGWLSIWSALGNRADLPRRLPSVADPLLSSRFGEPRLGLFWTAGNPAGLARELTDARTEFSFAGGHQGGSYRRPLDPGANDLTQVSATSWAPLSDRLSVLGRVVLDQERFDPGTAADETEPYATTPFITTDTSTTATRRTRARLEGAAAWRLGPWAVGAVLGYDTRENQTIDAGFRRRVTQTMPGLAIGVTRVLGNTVLGGQIRYRNRAETMDFTVGSADGQMIELQGYRGVRPIDVSTSFYRRDDEDQVSGGVNLGGAFAGGQWVMFAELGSVAERRTQQAQDNPAQDHWDAHSASAGLGYQRALGTRSALSVVARYTSLNGSGTVALDTTGTEFTAAEHALTGSLELRMRPTEERWSGGLRVETRYESRVRTDLTAGIGSDITSLTTSIALDVAHRVSPRVALFGGAAVGRYIGVTKLPAPKAQSAVYQQLIAPELDVYARDATPTHVSLGLWWRVNTRASLWFQGRSQSLSPRGQASPTGVGPNGTRLAQSIVVGVAVDGR